VTLKELAERTEQAVAASQGVTTHAALAVLAKEHYAVRTASLLSSCLY
jgi:hypothetical protein